jgi:cell wall-associated NlpC family hydrolase
MAGQNITFDFLTRGADSTASGFRKVGDNAALASRGAKVLADVIGKLGDKEDRTAAESKILASALRQTGEAEDRVTAKTVLADAAIRRLDDSMKDSKKSSGELGKALGGLKLNPGLVGPLVALAPAIATLGGVAAGAAAGLGGAFIAGAGALAAFGAVAKPVLTSAKTAADAVGKAQAAYNATLKAGVPTAQAQATLQAANASAQLTYTAALKGGTKPATALAALHLTLAKNQLAYNTATNAGTFAGKAYAAEQAAISKAYAGMSPQQIALSKQLGAMASAWQALKTAQTPVIAGALQPWLRSVTDLTKNLAPIIQAVSPVIQGLGGQFDSLINSSAFKGFRDFIAGTGSAAVSAGGSTIIDLIKSFMLLLPQFDPLIRVAVGWIAALGPAVLKWSSSKRASADIQSFIQFFVKNGPQVGTFLANIGGALKALAPGLTSGGLLEIKVISDFLGWVAKLPPAIAKPLAEVAGAALILSKMGGGGVIKFLVTGTLGGIFGGDGGAAGAAEAGGAASLWSKLAPGARLVGGTLAIALVVDAILKGTPSGPGGKNWFDNPFGMPGPNDKKSANNWLTSWSPYETFITKTVPGWFASGAHGAGVAWSGLGGSLGSTLRGISGATSRTTTGMASAFTHMSGVIAGAIQQTGRAADGLRTRNLTPLLGEAGKTSGGIQGLARYIHPGLSGALGTGGARVNAFRNNNLGPLRGELSKDSGGVQGLQGLINRMHGTTVRVNFVGSGSGSIAFRESVPGVTLGPSSAGLLGFHAAGGMISGGTPGRDSVLGMLMPGEVVVPASMVRGGAVDHLRGQLPGFSAGGAVSLSGITGPHGVLSAGQPYMAKAEAAFGRVVEAAFAKTVIAKFKKDMSALGGSGAAIVRYARGFLGQIPYVFGGNSLSGGIDCSGFTQQVYGHFGIHAPRTSESQFAWATPSGPVPGALAFYVSPAGGPPPGHVAIVQDAGTVISQGGGMGPNLMGLHAMPLMGIGVPKGGFPSAAGGGGNAAIAGGPLQAIAQSLLRQYGWGNQWNSFNSLETREAGWNMTARNPSSGAYGLAQFIDGPSEYFQYGGNPNTGLGQLTAMMNYIAQRYGAVNGPNNAWSHEVSAGWYGNGLNAVFRKPTLIGVGERGPEHVQVIPTGRGGAGGRIVLEVRGSGHGTFDAFLLKWIQEHVRVRGGGNVQTAFGRG